MRNDTVGCIHHSVLCRYNTWHGMADDGISIDCFRISVEDIHRWSLSAAVGQKEKMSVYHCNSMLHRIHHYLDDNRTEQSITFICDYIIIHLRVIHDSAEGSQSLDCSPPHFIIYSLSIHYLSFHLSHYTSPLLRFIRRYSRPHVCFFHLKSLRRYPSNLCLTPLSLHSTLGATITM